MAEYTWDEYGMRYYVDDNGVEIPSPEAGTLETAAIAAGKQFTDFGRGVRNFFGDESVRAEAQDAERVIAGLEAESPWATMIGSALPSLATAPIGGGGVLGGMATQAALGAAEGYLDYDTRASDGQRMAAGAIGGAAGDATGRILGRVMNGAKGLLEDVFLPRGQAVNEFAQAFEDVGGETLAYQRLAPGTRAQRLAERAARGAEAGVNPTGQVGRVMAANDQLYRNRAVEAVGLDPADFDNLGPTFKDAALDKFEREFMGVTNLSSAADALALDETTAAKLAKIPEIKELVDLGDFDGLAQNNITGSEWMTAREALSEAAANRMDNGRSQAGERLWAMVEELDNAIGQHVPDDFLADYARLREQYRVFRILERQNVVGRDGQVNVHALQNALESRASGFGRTATANRPTTNPETASLIETIQAGNRPEFQAFSTSSTAENLALRDTLNDAASRAIGLSQGDPREAMGLAARLAAPGVIAASNAGGGRMFEGMFTPSPASMAQGGGFIGRSMLDELLYPYVGAEDERRP